MLKDAECITIDILNFFKQQIYFNFNIFEFIKEQLESFTFRELKGNIEDS